MPVKYCYCNLFYAFLFILVDSFTLRNRQLTQGCKTLAASIMNDTTKFKTTAKNYLKARRDFLTIAEKTDWLFGNDNLVGRIGEFIAYQFLHDSNRQPKRPASKTEKGFDFICDNGKTRVSVKTITAENKVGSTTVITEPWDELILIIINENIKIEKLGILTKEQFQKATDSGHIKSKKPYARRTMLGPKGLISKFGITVDQKILNKYL